MVAELQSMDVRAEWDRRRRSAAGADVRVSVLATFSVEPLVPYLGIALADRGFRADLRVGPYARVAQECLTPNSVTELHEPDVLVVWPLLEDLWGGLPTPIDSDAEPYVSVATDLAAICLEAARRWSATLVFVLPAIPEVRPLGVGDASAACGVAATATAARQALHRQLAGRALMLDADDVVRQIGAVAAYDPRLLVLAHLPFSARTLDRVGGDLARLVRLSRIGARKVVVVDADNTLWGGVVGEDGANGIELGYRGRGAAHRAFQRYLQALRRAGWLLALCSKNDEADVWTAFARPEMHLKRDDLAAWRIGWSPKSQGLREIAAELGVGVDSLVFVDDSQVELAEVGGALPEVSCVLMPRDPAEWPTAVASASAFDRLPPTRDDLQRANFYRHERVRREAYERAGSHEDYLAGLGVRVAIEAPRPNDLPRLAQLVAKTNQFNLNCRRRSEAELATLCADPSYLARLVSARDRFGDYGVVGAVLAEREAGRLRVDTFVLSCRALGRGIERAMIAKLFEGGVEVTATVEVAPRNEPARQFFAELGCDAPGVRRQLTAVEWPRHIVLDDPEPTPVQEGTR